MVEEQIKTLEDRITALEQKLHEQSPEELAKQVEQIIAESINRRGYVFS